ncbi:MULTISPECIES: hypothetical protein [Paraburkholderia]|uniref:hypothetical protein n=1 Tax=Paraburkholderia TaxID=1822464 RepID=UPI00224FB53E|nr:MULTISPECIES: hypothetical protein [Paraburkholderia]MCX4177507.1 hypothetical protein [Paraburkholderia madseniana]MDQ6465496.1 hypothetical protein [Paraburkholderia madseniana]
MLSERPVDLLTMPFPAEVELLHPERAILLFGEGESFDIGAFCYTTRSVSGKFRKRRNRPRCEMLVDMDTFERSRVEPVRAAIRYFSELVTAGGKRVTTAGSWANCYRLFLHYAESNGYSDVLTDPSTVMEAFHAYVKHLRERIQTNTLSPTTAVHYQNNTMKVLSALTGIDTLHHGIDLSQSKGSDKQITEPPPDEDKGKVLALCHALFEGLSTLCLDSQPYPFALTVPRFMRALNDVLWIFPSRQWCMPPYQLADRESLGTPVWAFDYEAGTVFPADKIEHRYATKDSAKRAVATAKTAIARGNGTVRNVFRVNAAFTAHNAFVFLFLTHTGMNWAGVAALPWNEDYEVSMERQGFRTIKYRAGGRLVSFEIQNIFMPAFKRFLKLRTYLLDGRDFDPLFLNRPLSARENSVTFELEPLADSGLWLWRVYKSLLNIHPDLPVLGSRKFRAAKSDVLLRAKEDPVTVARVLQNSIRTVLRSYAAGSPRTQESEFADFFDGLQGAVIAKGEQIENGVEIPVGKCSAHGSPHQSGDAPVSSDCQTPEGCLFCDKYKVHADEPDVRKLASCRYCIERTAHLADSHEQFQTLFGPIFERIQNLLDEIDQRSPGVVSRIVREVEAGELDPYWSGKLEMLINLELAI